MIRNYFSSFFYFLSNCCFLLCSYLTVGLFHYCSFIVSVSLILNFTNLYCTHRCRQKRAHCTHNKRTGHFGYSVQSFCCDSILFYSKISTCVCLIDQISIGYCSSISTDITNAGILRAFLTLYR